MNKYILVDTCREEFNASFKAVDDIKEIAIKEGFIPLKLNMRRSKKKLIKRLQYIKYVFQDIKLFKKGIDGENIVLVQIPARFPNYIMLLYLFKLKQGNSTVVAVVHDVEQLRYDIHFIFSKIERIIYSKMDKIVVHNDRMKKYFIELGIPKEKVFCIEIFDYLIANKLEKRKIDRITHSIAIAGNLDFSKAGYIYKLGQLDTSDIVLNLYGNNYKEMICKNVVYRGKFASDKIPEILHDSDNMFGLVWDGDSLEECSGKIGQYQKYNNPHKLSLYIASGLPVIVWKKSASYQFVKNNNIGIGIDTLKEIQSCINDVSKEKYDVMQENVYRIGQQLRSGGYTKRALKKLSDNRKSERKKCIY